MAIKNKLKEIRMQEYLIDSKSEFARQLGVEIHTYIKWEAGKSTPNLEKALEVSKKLNRKIDEIWYLE